MKRLLTLFAVLMCWSAIYAVDTDISTLANVVYIESGSTVTIAEDGTAVIPIKMKNSAENVTGYQFNLYLPDGMTASQVTLAKSDARKSDNVSFSSATQTDGSIKVVGYTSDNIAFSGTDGEIATITIPNATAGGYTFTLKEIKLSAGGTSIVTGLETTSTVTLEATSYEEGYALTISPYTATSLQNVDVYLKCPDRTIASIKFDAIFPTGMTMSQATVNANRLNNSSFSAFFPCSLSGNTITCASSLSTAVWMTGTEGVALTIPVLSTASDGVYCVELKNITVTDVDGTVHVVTPTSTYVKVGTPTKASLVLSGHITSEVNAALATETSIGSLDMSGVTSMDGTLTLVDGRNFVGPTKSVKVPEITYTRSNVSSTWGTICLPYAVTSDDKVQYYTLDKIAGSTLYLTKINTVDAGTPAAFERLGSGTTLTTSATDATITGDISPTTSNDLKFVGTYEKLYITNADSLKNSYYISKNQFHQATVSLTMNPFRAFFINSSLGARSNTLDIAPGDATTSIGGIFQNTENVEGYYDANGRKIDRLHDGVNIIHMTDGTTQKVIINNK